MQETMSQQEMPHGSRTPIGESTPLTIGLAIVLLGLAFSMGVTYKSLSQEQETNAKQDVIIEQQSELIRQNAIRLDLMEARLDYERSKTP